MPQIRGSKITLSLKDFQALMLAVESINHISNFGLKISSAILGKYAPVMLLATCGICDGTGMIYDPNDPRDMYEGNKLRGIISCHKCNGEGVG